ncbi:peptidoglycan-binding protein, partial [Streptomyces sp. NPDC003667]
GGETEYLTGVDGAAIGRLTDLKVVPGTLRQGDTGPEVTELQQRLLRVPDVYRDGSTSGTYDAPLTEAVARFQLWYGISGDETGVYGDDTRRALESRTVPGAAG